jgi:GT2 family glycosyltransferase
MKAIDYIINGDHNLKPALRIIVPTSSADSPRFKKCYSHIQKSSVPDGTVVTAVISSGSDFVFAKSVNFGLMKVLDEDILLLNDDCYVEANTISNVIKSIRPDDGVVGALLRYSDGRVQHNGGVLQTNFLRIMLKDTISGAPLYSIRSYLKARKLHTRYIRSYHNFSTKPIKLHYVTGAFFFIKNRAFKDVGYFDENFINGFEDLDYCLRMRNFGYGVRVEESSEAVHEEHASLVTHEGHYFDNLIWFNQKWDKSDLTTILRYK